MTEEKTVLIVDDRPEALAVFIDALKDNGFAVHWEETLDDTVAFIKRNSTDIAGVVIDLHMPGNSEIAHYENHYRVTINKGQSLGLFLREHFPKLPYLFFSSFEGSYDRPKTLPENEEERLLTKYNTDEGQFVDICRKAFNL